MATSYTGGGRMVAHNMVTTQFELDGFRVTRTLGVVRGIVVRSRSIFGTIGAGLQTLVGGNITLLTNLCEKTRAEAFDLMLQHAAELGGNAVVGARYDATEVMQGVTEVLAYGTAVFVEAGEVGIVDCRLPIANCASVFVHPARDQRGQDGAQPHLDHPAKRKPAVAGEPGGLREVIREAGEETGQKADLQRGAGTGSQALTRPGVKMRDRDRQNKQKHDPLDYEEGIARSFQEKPGILRRQRSAHR